MTISHKITIGALVICFLMLCVAGYGWVSKYTATAILSAEQRADAEAAVKIANAEEANQENLKSALADSKKLRSSAQTPTQIVTALPKVITLPAPIYQYAQVGPDSIGSKDGAVAPKTGDLIIPQESAKTFFDTQSICADNLTKLNSCTLTHTNDLGLIAVKDEEIKQQTVALKGGTFWHRVGTASKFIAVGFTVGAVAVVIVEAKVN